MMTRPTLLFGMIVLAVLSVARFSGPKVHPAIKGSVYDNITSFENAHPDWRVLEEDRIDLAAIRFGHQEHMDPNRSQMQDKLQSWVDRLREAGVANSDIPVRRLDNGRLSLTCASCHVTDSAGQYMLPISFDNHCMQCHSLQEQQGEPVPHGREIGMFVERLAMKGALEPPKKPSVGRPGGASRGGPPGASGPPKTSSGPPAASRPSGPPTSRSGPPGAKASSSDSDDDQPTIEELYAKITADASNNHKRLIRTVKATCARCHGNAQSPDQIPDPRIPDRWLTRSAFNHSSHAMMRCDSCHSQAIGSPDEVVSYVGQDDPDHPAHIMRWTGRTRDIMMPDIETCRTCHTPTGGAPTNCVLCHAYHPETSSHEGGAFRSELNVISLDEYAKLGRGYVEDDKKSAAENASSEADRATESSD